ncbi:MAG: phenylalanine--tRNA ligase subunit beta, partial [Beggiatoa sp. IS2]
GPVVEVADETMLPPLTTIPLRATRIKRLLGYAFAPATIRQILNRLGMSVQHDDGETWQVQPPSFRFDVTVEVDLIEELARVHGYNNLPIQAPTAPLKLLPQPSVTIEQIQSVLIQRGYQEAITYSFVDPQRQADLTPEVETIRLTNPISNDMAIMRTTLWTGLLQALLYNQHRQQLRVRLFEQGLRFIRSSQGIQQDKMLAGLVSGACYQEQWGETHRSVDFFDVKADVEALLDLTGEKMAYRFVTTQHPALHPGQSAAIYRGEQPLGLIGALHPLLVQKLEITVPIYLFELQLTPLSQSWLPKFTEISKYPSIRRDIALTVATTITATEILTQIKQNAPHFLTEMRLFDVYQGKGVEPGKKSLAIGLIFQEFSRNLLESEVDTVMTQIVSQLEQNLDAQLRK